MLQQIAAEVAGGGVDQETPLMDSGRGAGSWSSDDKKRRGNERGRTFGDAKAILL